MNRNQVKGGMKEAAGKIQEKVGQATDNKSQQAKGLVKQAGGKTQKTAGNVQENLRKT